MKATDLLTMQHKTVDALFARFEKAEGDDTKAAIFEELAASLVAHDAIEREIFYPACEEKMGLTDLLGAALVEHGVVEFMLFRADHNLGKDTLDHHVKVLKEVVEHHVEEEQDELFPKVEKALGAALLNELGEQMKARFDEALEEDFRPALIANLTQVLDGAMKTAPASDEDSKPAKKAVPGKTKAATPAKNGKGRAHA